MSEQISIEDNVTVGNLAEKLSIPASQLIGELMKNGIMATVNEQVDFDTAQIISQELDLGVELVRESSVAQTPVTRKSKVSDKAEPRPPIIAVMGHVDHGKTSLLNAIRKQQTTEEAGGITQYISAYQVIHNQRTITFLDTPGHEAFAAIRQHGAHLTDVALIVVAADDGVKPQTIEAIKFAKTAGVKIVVAINKIDKPEADQNRIKQQLADNDLLIEEWGGDIVVVPVSATTGEGLDKLLDIVLLVADIEDLKADIDVPAEGLVIEANMEKGRGAVATLLVESGVVRKGDFIVAGSAYARVRSLESTEGQPVKQAKPSMPVVVSGLKSLPEFGDSFRAVGSEKVARSAAKTEADKRSQNTKQSISSAELLHMMNRSRDLSELNVIIKADVQGSLTSISDSLRSLNTDEVAVKIVNASVGAINDTDAHMAKNTKSIIYGFNVDFPASVKKIANRDKINVRLYTVIYELIDDVKAELTKLLTPEVVEKSLGRVQVKGVFKTTKDQIICGGKVTKGKLIVPALARIFRDKEQIAEVEVVGLQRGKQDAKEVIEGEMCGLSLKTPSKVVLEIDDTIELFNRDTVARSL